MSPSPTPSPGLTPSWMFQWHQRLNEACGLGHDAILRVCADWLQVPLPDDCPTPGAARNWAAPDWDQWGREHGYELSSRTAHSHLYKHKFVPHLVIGVSTTPGDCRTPMACAREVRAAVREVCHVVRLVGLLYAGINSSGPVAAVADDEDAVRRAFGARLTSYISGKPVAIVSDLFCQGDIPEALRESMMALLDASSHVSVVEYDDVERRLRILRSEFHISRERAFAEINAPTLNERMKLLKPGECIRLGVDVVAALTDLIDEYRATAKMKLEQTRAPRKEPAPAPPLRDVIQGEFAAHAAAVHGCMHEVEKLAQSLVDRVRLVSAKLPQPPRVPEVADPAAVAAAVAERDAAVAVVTERDAAIAGLRRQLEEAGDAKHVADQVAAARAFAEVTVEVLKGVAQMNPFQMVSALQTLQQQAEEVVAKLAPKAAGVAA